MTSWSRWQDWSAMVLGAWLFISPWIFGHVGSASAWNAWTVGVVVVVISLWTLAQPSSITAEGTAAVVGLWLFIAPWVLGFSALAGLAWNAWIVAILLVGVALWGMARTQVAR